jgi:ferredoxin-NADP reductase
MTQIDDDDANESIASGVLHVAKLFRRVVLVATGSGIGPCLAVLRAGEVEARVLWFTREPQDTYGRAIIDDVLKANPQAMIHDTQSRGRPDVGRMAYGLYIQAHAEAVIIISNPALTHRVAYGLESRRVLAFSAIWDS